MAAVSADGSTVCGLIRHLNSSCSRSMALVKAAPLTWRQTRQRDEPIAGFLQAVGDGAMLEPPFAAASLISSRVAAYLRSAREIEDRKLRFSLSNLPRRNTCLNRYLGRKPLGSCRSTIELRPRAPRTARRPQEE